MLYLNWKELCFTRVYNYVDEKGYRGGMLVECSIPIIKKVNDPQEQEGGHSALDYAGLLAGGAGTYFGIRGDAVHNSMYWVQKNGTVRLASAVKSNVLYKNSYKVDGNLTSASKIASTSFAGAGTVISGVQFVSNPTYANAFDVAMGLTSFIPVAGWAISGTYFIANIGCQIITDKTLGQQIFGDTKVY